MKSTIRWKVFLFDWRFFPTKTCSCKGMDYRSKYMWTLLSFWLSNCFPHWWLCTSSLRTYILLRIYLWVLCSSCPTLLTLPSWWHFELLLNHCYPLWLLEVFHMLCQEDRFQKSASHKAHMVYKKRRLL